MRRIDEDQLKGRIAVITAAQVVYFGLGSVRTCAATLKWCGGQSTPQQCAGSPGNTVLVNVGW